MKKEKHVAHPEAIQAKPDLTNFDFSGALLFKSKASSLSYHAEQLQADEVIVRSWGKQEMKKGDWVLFKPDSQGGYKRSGVRKEAFESTYVRLASGEYQKQTYIRACRIDFDYTFLGVDSEKPEHAPSGSYIVLNCDRHRNPIIINGRRDIFFYLEEDIVQNFEIVENR